MFYIGPEIISMENINSFRDYNEFEINNTEKHAHTNKNTSTAMMQFKAGVKNCCIGACVHILTNQHSIA